MANSYRLLTCFAVAFASIFTGSASHAQTPEFLYTAVEQPDGKIVLGGSFSSYYGATRHNIARSDQTGLDTSFYANVNGAVEVILLQDDGKLVISGPFTTVNGVSQSYIARLNADGSLDTGFAPTVNDDIAAPAIQPDGKIVIVGEFTTVNGTTRNRIARINTDGTLDTSFDPNSNGKITTLVIRPDGKIIVSGIFSNIGGANRSYFAQLSASGNAETIYYGGVHNSPGMLWLQRYEPGVGDKSFIDVLFSSDYYYPPIYRFDTYQGLGFSDHTFSNGDTTSSYYLTGLSATVSGKTYVTGAYTSGEALFHENDSNYWNLGAGYNGVIYGSLVKKNGVVTAVGQADGTILATGFDPTPFTGAAPASDSLQITATDTLDWKRSGASPMTTAVKFELSTDSGSTWSPLSTATFFNGDWRATGLTLPSNGLIRARAPVMGGYRGMSRGIVESISSIAPEIEVFGNNLEISNGDTSPSMDDHTQFGTFVATGYSGQTRTFTIANQGASPLTIDTSSITGTHSSDFGFNSFSLPVEIPGNSKKTFEVYFNPSGTGVRTANIILHSNDSDESSYEFAIEGEGIDPNINITGNGAIIANDDATPSVIDHTEYGTVTAIGGFETRTYTVQNTGVGDLIVSNITIPNGSGDFVVSGISFPVTVPSSSSTTFTVTYAPLSAGQKNVTINVLSNDGAKPVYKFWVRGAAYPQLKIRGNGILIADGDTTPAANDGTNFGTVETEYHERTFTMENEGAAPLYVGSIPLSGQTAGFQRYGMTFGFYLAPGATRDVTIRYTPVIPGTRTATVTINSDDPTSPVYDFAIRGEAYREISIKGTKGVIPDDSSIPSLSNDTDFGTVNVSTGSQSFTYTISNTRGVPLTVSSILKGGATPSDFTVTAPSTPFVIPAQGNATFTVSFTPLTTGTHSAIITVNNDDDDEATYDFAIVGCGAVQFSAPTDIPITYNNGSLSGDIFFSLAHAPLPGAQLKVIDNTGLGFITGSYSNLKHGDEVILTHNSIDYYFVVNYYGGDGNDLVLQWAYNQLYSWGAAANGRLGDEFIIPASPVNKMSPVAVISSGVLAEKKILSIAAGGMHTLALLSDGNIAAWGDNSSGQLGNNSTASSPVPVLVDTSTSSALNNKQAIAVAAGYNFSLALCVDKTTGDRSLVAWGENGSGQAGDGVAAGTDVLRPKAVTVSAALTGKTVVRIAAGPAAYHSLAVCIPATGTGDPSVIAWGRNTSKCLGHNSTATMERTPVTVTGMTSHLSSQNIAAMSVGTDFSLVLCSDKVSNTSSVFGWGSNGSGRLGYNSTAASTATPETAHITSLISGSQTITSISAGEAHVLALRSDGAAISWGINTYGRLGINSTTLSRIPVLVKSTSTSPASVLNSKVVLAVTAGQEHSYALYKSIPGASQTPTFSVASWGRNDVRQLGTGTTDATKIFPSGTANGAILAGHRLTAISSGFDHAVALVAQPDMADSDGDGLPDFWEILYGLNPNDASGVNGANGDLEPDGQTNLTEYANNTPPNLTNANPNPGGGTGNPQTPNPSDFVLSFDHPEAYLLYEEQKNGSGVFVPSSAELKNYLNVSTYYSGTGIPAISSMKASNLFPGWHDTNPTWESPVDSLLLHLDHQNVNLNGTSLRNYQWWKSRLRLKSDSNLPQGCKVKFIRLRTETQPPLATVTTALDVVSFSIPKNGRISPELPLPNRTEPPQPSWSSSKSLVTRLSLIQSFIDNQGIPYKNYNESLGVSNYVTTDGLPTTSSYYDVCDDPKNFRLQAQVTDPSVATVQMTLEVVRANVVVTTHTYQLDQKSGTSIRGRFLRLVADIDDDAASGAGTTSDPHDQTILVRLGDTLRSRYEISPGLKVEDEIQVGRPEKEDNNDPAKPWKHDIRKVNLRLAVFTDVNGTPCVTDGQIDQDIENANERLAQSGIVIQRSNGNTPDRLPQPASFSDGYSSSGGHITIGTADENAIAPLKDNDVNTIDVFYVPLLITDGGRASSYPVDRNLSNDPKYNNMIVVSAGSAGGVHPITLAHEIMHVLLNSGHRNDPNTAVFRGGTSPTKAVGGTKRIGPYPDATTSGVGQNDTTTIRQNAETLP